MIAALLCALLLGSLVPAPALAQHEPPPPSLWEPDPADLPEDAATFVHLESTAGDYVGQGETYSYRTSVAYIDVEAAPDGFIIGVEGNERWHGSFSGPAGGGRLQEGYHHDLSAGSLSWSGEQRSCVGLSGWFVVDEVTYATDGSLLSLRLRFGQSCDNSSSSPLHGLVVYDAAAPQEPSPNPRPIPTDLWEPAPEQVPTNAATYVHLESIPDGDDDGESYSYRTSTAQIEVTTGDDGFVVDVRGDETWSGTFVGVDRGPLEHGFYDDAQHARWGNPRLGGLVWGGEGRSCSEQIGWMAVDEISYSAGKVVSLRLRFAQYCGDGLRDFPLHGQIVYDAAAPQEPSPNPRPIPDGLWEPDPNALPQGAATFVHLESEPGDPVGGGGVFDHRTSTSRLYFAGSYRSVKVRVHGDQVWNGLFVGTDESDRLVEGFYDDLQKAPDHNPRLGGLDWGGDLGGSCTQLVGWMAVDELVFDGNELRSLRIRFEQRCERSDAPALRGLIVYDAAAPVEPSPHPHAIPEDLWSPDESAIPQDAATFVHLESTDGDMVGAGSTYDYRTANSLFEITPLTGGLRLRVIGDERWRGDFVGTDESDRLEEGFYDELLEAPFHNPRLGGLSWSGGEYSCGFLAGWFAVDEITHGADGAVRTLRLRFEQRCTSGNTLRGLIVYDADAPQEPSPNPVPVPGDLWEPDPADLPPDALTFVHLERTGAGTGTTYDYRTANSRFHVTAGYHRISVGVLGDETWSGTFAGTDEEPRLRPGLYSGLQQVPWHNPRLGGVSWHGEDLSCGYQGWFAVDEVTYGPDDVIESLRLRFEQQCGGTETLRGLIVFDRSAPQEPSPNPMEIPSDYWRPAPSLLPKAGTYVLLEGEEGDYVSGGQTEAYAASMGDSLQFSTAIGGVDVEVREAGNWPEANDWGGTFRGTDESDQLEVGYYPGLQATPFHNTRRGGLEWRGSGRGCGALYAVGSFVVDHAEYLAGELQRLRMRFTQRCRPDKPALRGEIVYSIDGKWPGLPPDTYFVSTAPDRSTSPTAAFVLDATELGTTFECQLDGGAWSACPSELTLDGLVDGQHDLAVRAIDDEGNIDATPVHHAWHIDSTPPESTITAGPDGSTTSARFSFTAVGAPVRFDCRLDGGPWSRCASPQEHRDLAQGWHLFEVRARDSMANIEATPARWRWFIDSVQPVVDRDWFTDDDGSAFEPAIEAIAAAGVTRGCNPPTNTLFCPHDRVTRGQMAAFLQRALKLDDVSGDWFTDDDGSAFEPAIEAIAAAGITRGCNPPRNTRFCPEAHVTRAQMAAFLQRALDLPEAGGDWFTDDDGSAFEPAIEAIAAAGITRGCNPPGNTRFCPEAHVTRAQMAAFLQRALDL